ncbi:predicted protein [Sclerotinia sclerotiorum 1980 UF-70]|uniref:Uncharacterized protein n=2 Tax=Sclerotinia sclerotiorum (strain ATCC 18683 / 1980 / Ss-1) TaxID=665079 RepID=A7ER30_SCLS1|nr:predicted protein [Sclerotinia sclerotiorum 1980 UF-70]EDN91922.1 predicted protein [Sclerotinia sclerotiorum 1980 UF-70]
MHPALPYSCITPPLLFLSQCIGGRRGRKRIILGSNELFCMKVQQWVQKFQFLHPLVTNHGLDYGSNNNDQKQRKDQVANVGVPILSENSIRKEVKIIMKVTYALTALSLLGVAVALPTLIAKRDAQPEEATNYIYAVGVESEKRDARPSEEATNYFYAVGAETEKRDAKPEEAANYFYVVGAETEKRDAQPAEEATNFFYAVGTESEKRDTQPEEATNYFYVVGTEIEKRSAKPEEATKYFYTVGTETGKRDAQPEVALDLEYTVGAETETANNDSYIVGPEKRDA